MIDYEKSAEFCSKNNLTMEELFLLYTLHLRNEYPSAELNKVSAAYYASNRNKGIAFVDMVNDLHDRGFLEILKQDEPDKIDVKNLRITEEFGDLLFVDPDFIWNKFYLRYPAEGYMDGKYFTANMLDPKGNDKQVFIKKVLKTVNKDRALELLYVLEDMFDWDPISKKPNRRARVGISKFLMNWDEILKQWKEDNEMNIGGGYKSL